MTILDMTLEDATAEIDLLRDLEQHGLLKPEREQHYADIIETVSYHQSLRYYTALMLAGKLGCEEEEFERLLKRPIGRAA